MRPISSIVLAALLACIPPMAFAQAASPAPAGLADTQESPVSPVEADADAEASADAVVATPAVVAVQAVEERPICRQEKPSGSNRPVRVCRTKSQMQADRDASRARMERGTFVN